MKRNVYRILGCFLFAFTLCIMTPSFAKASVKNIPQTKTSGTYTGNVDITGDGNADSVIIRTTPDQEGWYINRFTIYLNGKRTTEISLRDHDCYYLTVKYAKMSKQHTFIQIIGRGENDYVTYNEIFTYNKKSNQFRVVKSFNDHSSYAEEIVTANKKGITVKHRVQPMETGWINWTLPFKYLSLIHI